MSRPLLVTFSGLDGSGKTTLIAALAADLRSRGRRARVLTMYDDVSLYSYLRGLRDRARSLLGRRSDGRGGGGGAAGSGPLYDIVRSSPVRRLAFFGDVASVLFHRRYHGLRGDDVLVFDRYLYDTIADAADGGWPSIGTLLRLAPLPDVPILVDVDPERAFARKGEYDVPYLMQRRSVYESLFARIPGAVVVRNDDLGAATDAVLAAVAERSR